MQTYYYKDSVGNFGDDLNGWLWNRLLPGFFDDDSLTRLSVIGTIINDAMPKADKWFVFTSGVGYGHLPEGFGDSSWEILSVRGPLSAKVLGLGKDKYITDGAALLNTLPEFKPLSESERDGVIFIPHHHAIPVGNWERVCKLAGVEYVSPQWDSVDVIHKIRKSKLVIADAMHAAIIADAMRVPWVPAISSPQINTFKWLDWALTIDMPYLPINIGPSYFHESIKSQTLKFYGENYELKDKTAESAIKDFYFKKKYKSSALWPNYCRASRILSYNLPYALINSFGKGYVARKNEAYTALAVDYMLKAKDSNGFLSEDNIFSDNVDKLMSKLDYLKKFKGVS
ncbi:polysaccharide pyruvyl transferase family protein [Raoultella planticola]|uniref:polysaccharide pyruvyl transferase family protein n=1 Tax=Raoultella planticola TaxID=575 RepID=UPI0007EC1CD0|nr:polysaccharide pyruvyl transferase family protein [Raoultella planticola]MDY7626035.1 polysaccharide pyruvyl transferase family protein [Raoultella planticola]OAZ77798.1 exosortase [Raoultella planticola]OAZ81378.1 exosortase [Raoultella planticola]